MSTTPTRQGEGVLWRGSLCPEPPSSHYYALRRAPDGVREFLTALVIFQRDAGAIPWTVSDPAVGRAKAQWWRSELARIAEGGGDHPIAPALREWLAAGAVPLDDLRATLSAVEDDLDGGGFADMADLVTYGVQLGGGTYRAAARGLTGNDDAAVEWARAAGGAVTLVGRFRMLGRHLRQGRVYLPHNLLRHHGLSEEDLVTERGSQHRLEAALREHAEHLDGLFRETDRINVPRRPRRRLRPLLAHAALHRALLGQLRHQGVPVLRHRIHLTPLRKLWIAQRAR